jgi:hypothetical protein
MRAVKTILLSLLLFGKSIVAAEFDVHQNILDRKEAYPGLGIFIRGEIVQGDFERFRLTKP